MSKTFDQYLTEMDRPGGALADRSLEAFPTLLQQLMMAAKGIMNPQTKQAVYQILNPFNQQMSQLLQSQQQANQGFSQNYQPNQNPGLS